MNNENFQEPEKGEPGPTMIIMGVQDQVRCFYGENGKNFSSVLKDVLNVSIDYLNVVYV